MLAKEYLEQLWDLDKKVESKMRERDWVVRRADMVGLTDDMELLLRQYDDEVNDYIDSLLRLEIDVIDKIMKLEDYTHQMIIRERYLFGKKWQEISDEQHYELSSLHYKHNKALEEFSKLMMEDECITQGGY